MTERKTPDSELFKEKENGLYFRAIFDSQSDAISITQISNGSFKYINKAFVNFTGYTQKELIGKNTSSINLFVHPEDAIKLIARNSEGSVRDSISLLDRALISQSIIENKIIEKLLKNSSFNLIANSTLSNSNFFV